MSALRREGGEVVVRSGAGSYPVVVEAGVLDRLAELLARYVPAFRYAVVSDDRVAPLHATRVVEALGRAGMDIRLFTFPAGEAHKTRKQWSILTDEILDWGMGRDGAVIAVGGGVTGDLAGFVAATFLRGVPVVQVPTSLVAMIDASVGGKTGVDVRAGKNLVGAFHPPRAVLADPRTVATLSRIERARGWVEAVKHGAIADAGYFETLTREAPALLEGQVGATAGAVLRSVEIKAGVVSADEKESGLREVLNFGHTLGHALEAASGYALSHGEAVAAGMVLEARLGESLGMTRQGTADRILAALEAFGMADPGLDGVDAGAAARYLEADKKARGGVPRFVLLAEVGEVARGEGWSHPAPPGAAEALLSEAVAAGSVRGAGRVSS